MFGILHFGFVNKFLGISFKVKGSEKVLYNPSMIERLLSNFKMEFSNPVATLTPLEVYLCSTVVRSLRDAMPYRELVGLLLHLANTVRPDIACAVEYLLRYLNQQTEGLCKMGKRIVRYLRETIELGIVY